MTATPHRKYLLVFVFLYLLYQSPVLLSNALKPVVVSAIISSAKTANIELRITDSELKLPRSLYLSNVNARNNTSSIPTITIDSINIRINSFYPILTRVEAKFLSGIIICDISPLNLSLTSISLDKPIITNCNFNGISLGSFAPLFALGISGFIDGDISSSTSINQPILNTLRFNIGISNGYFDGIQKGIFDTKQYAISSLIKIPPVNDVQLQLKGVYEKDNINLESGNLLSSMGSFMDIQGLIPTGSFDPVNSENLTNSIILKLNGMLTLNSTGVKYIAPWLSLNFPNKEINEEPIQLQILKMPGRDLELSER
ncbi:MAG TPA: hypothetical protein PKA63_04635 [Oligoflexia bacterium]|nr:hypothetical protein [Oligoflexia bacterium]HMP47937.1 hypothetical protein [Oligoflexia bacterium]